MPLDIQVTINGEGTLEQPYTAIEGDFSEAEFNRLKIFTIDFESFYVRYKSRIVLMNKGRTVFPTEKIL